MRAAKGNKEYGIDDTQKKFYQDAGYDILDDEGNTIAYGRGKTITYEEYSAVKKELEELKENGGKDENNKDVIDILTAFANEHGVNLGNSKSVSGIVKKIKEHKPGGGE